MPIFLTQNKIPRLFHGLEDFSPEHFLAWENLAKIPSHSPKATIIPKAMNLKNKVKHSS